MMGVRFSPISLICLVYFQDHGVIFILLSNTKLSEQ